MRALAGNSTDQDQHCWKTSATRITTVTLSHSRPLFIDNGEEEAGGGADIRLSSTEITSTDSFVTYKAVSANEGKNGAGS